MLGYDAGSQCTWIGCDLEQHGEYYGLKLRVIVKAGWCYID
jgi:hypothetical protein